MYYVYRDFVGLNEIEPFLNDYFVEDVECNGADTPIYIVHRKYRNLRTNITYNNLDQLTNLVEKLAQKCGKYISYANPLLDGALPDGSIDYEEPIIYRENGIVKISKIGAFVDRFYKENESNKPIPITNVEVPAFDNDKLKISWKKVDYVYKHKINEDLFELKLEFGRKIRLTGYHSVFSLQKGGVKAERTDKLKLGDYIALPLKIPENDVIKEMNVAEELSKTDDANRLIIDNIPEQIYKLKKRDIINYLNKNYKRASQTYYEHKKKRILPLKLFQLLRYDELKKCKIRHTSAIGIPAFLDINKELIQLLGLYAAEGWLYDYSHQYGVCFSLNKKEVNLIETISRVASKCFGLDIDVQPDKENAVKIRINSYLLWILFKDILDVSKGAKEKRIPNIIFNINKELQKEFLRYWSLGDYGSTASIKLANDISYLSLINNEVVAFYDREREALFDKIRKVRSHEFYTNFFVRSVENSYPSMIPINIFNPLKETNHRFSNTRISRERLNNILNGDRYNRFMNLNKGSSSKFITEWSKRGFIQDKELTPKGQELVNEIKIINKLVNSDLAFAKIKSISRVKPSSEFVYDISVKDDENFVGGFGGICCHNSRANATYTSDISSKGPTFTIRRFTKEPWTPIRLMEMHTASPEILAYLWLLIEYEASIMIIGGTSSGKTTFLNAVSFFIPPQARIVSIEDTREINLQHANWLPSVARQGIGTMTLAGTRFGEITLFDLLKESFRQNPDYVIVGEVRGQEAYVLFQGISSGHPSLSTMHANSVGTLIRRLETQPINLSSSLINSLDVVCTMVQTKSKGKDVRRVRDIVEVVDVKEGIDNYIVNTPFVWDPRNDNFFFKTDSHIFKKLNVQYGISKEELDKEFQLRTRLLIEMYRHRIFGFKEVQEVISLYYKNPKGVLRKFGII